MLYVDKLNSNKKNTKKEKSVLKSGQQRQKRESEKETGLKKNGQRLSVAASKGREPRT